MGELIEEENDWKESKILFLARWPLEKVKSMTLEEYTNLDRNDSFAYWLESKTSDVLGIGGGSSYKFGIFKRNPYAPEKELKPGQLSDGEYGWYGKYGQNKESAFNKIKALVLEVIEATRNNEFDKIDTIDLGNAYKWKIAYMYADENKLLRIASDKAFRYLAKKYSIDSNNISVIQNTLISNKDLNENFDEYSSRLWNEYYDNSFMETEFRVWLKKEKALAPSTINKYINRLIKSIPEQLHKSNMYTEITNLIGTRFEVLQKIYSMLQAGGDLYDWNISTKVKSEASAALGNYLEFIEKVEEIDDNNIYVYSEDNKVNNPLNQILYGPPGTGKTYKTINKALDIIFEKVTQGNQKKIFSIKRHENDNREKEITYEKALKDDDRVALNSIFEAYKTNGQIEFVTFHQSYGYEEFVEGIKALDPEHEDNNTGELIYRTMPGIFKNLCERARKRKIINNNFEISDNAKLWKVSLEGARETVTKQYCFDHNVIRIGWDDYGNLNKTDRDLKTALNYFYNEMNIGDLFVSLYDAKTIDGIGVIMGDYEYNDSLKEYKHQRKVHWLVKNEKIYFHDLNKQHDLVQSTIYKLKHVDHNELLSVISAKTKSFETLDNDQNYVLIIDEINRGNISKIFGELITLIENCKRQGSVEEVVVTLPYSGEQFSVPSNLYIVGTMNTADRSIALMDTALRRRFDFEEMMPLHELLVNIDHPTKQLLKELEQKNISDENDLIINKEINVRLMLKKINERIEYLYDRDHQIGHAYFISLKNLDENIQFSELQNIFKNKVIPLLQEYFYDDWEKIRLVLADNQMENNTEYQFIKQNEKLKDAKSLFGSVSDEVFDDEKVVYMLNEDAFTKAQSYIKIYSPITTKSINEEISTNP